MAGTAGLHREIALRTLSRAAETVKDAAEAIGGAGYSGTWRDLIAEARWHLDTAEQHLGGPERPEGNRG